MFVVIWKFVPKIGLEKEFEKIYGPHGLWTELFAQVNDYLGTSLLKEVDSDNVYLAVDKWKSKDAYDSFKLRFFEEYHTIDQRCKDITNIEQIIGEFNTKY
ncbi:MAG: hypothetical protein WB779_00220 [Ignavibacteriaceae bacterium]